MSEVPKIVKQTEGALPEVCLFILYQVGSVEHLPRWLPSHDAHHCADDKLPLVKALRGLSRQQTELLLLGVKIKRKINSWSAIGQAFLSLLRLQVSPSKTEN